MKVYSTILQGSEATEDNAINFAKLYDFSEDEICENTALCSQFDYIDTIKGIDIYYNFAGDYYFFSKE